MFIPPLCNPHDLIGSDRDTVESMELECICKKRVMLKNCMCVYTTKQGDKKPAWFAVCARMCVLIHISAGNC